MTAKTETNLFDGDPALGSDAGLRERKVSLYDALEFIAKRGRVCGESCNSTHIAGIVNQMRGVIWLFTGEDPGHHSIQTLRDVFRALKVPYAEVKDLTDDDKTMVWWGDEYAKRAGQTVTVPDTTTHVVDTHPVTCRFNYELDDVDLEAIGFVRGVKGKAEPGMAAVALTEALDDALAGWREDHNDALQGGGGDGG